MPVIERGAVQTSLSTTRRAAVASQRTMWRNIAHDLVDGTNETAFELEFTGTTYAEANTALSTAGACLARYRVNMAKDGTFKRVGHVFAIQRRGLKLFVYNVALSEAHKHWNKAQEYGL